MSEQFICVGAARLPQFASSDMMGLGQIPYTEGRFDELTGFEELVAKGESTVVGSVVLALQLLRPVGAVVAGIHGYRRNNENWGAALGWGALGFIFPVITNIVGLAQGYGKAKDVKELGYRRRGLGRGRVRSPWRSYRAA